MLCHLPPLCIRGRCCNATACVVQIQDVPTMAVSVLVHPGGILMGLCITFMVLDIDKSIGPIGKAFNAVFSLGFWCVHCQRWLAHVPSLMRRLCLSPGHRSRSCRTWRTSCTPWSCKRLTPPCCPLSEYVVVHMLGIVLAIAADPA